MAILAWSLLFLCSGGTQLCDVGANQTCQMAHACSRHILSIWEGVDRQTLKREGAFKNKQASKQTRDVIGKTSVTFKDPYTPDVKLKKKNGTKV